MYLFLVFPNISNNCLDDPIRYITEFQWDHAKYPTKQSLKNLSEIIAKVGYLNSVVNENNVDRC
jgi:hypothetical protein